MNNVELNAMETYVTHIAELRAEVRRLTAENRDLKTQIAKQELNRQFGVPAMYGCTPGNDEIRKEGEA